MCGIIALVRAPGARRHWAASDVLDRFDAIQAGLSPEGDLVATAEAAKRALAELDALLLDTDGVALLVREQKIAIRARAVCATVADWVEAAESRLDVDGPPPGQPLEAANAALLSLKDALWAVERDRLPTAERVRDFVGAGASWSAIEVATSIQQALSALDRLEVRGRDSAGLTVLVQHHGLDLADPAIARLVAARDADALFRSLSVRTPEGHLSFVYKAAAEIGELGDNTRSIRTTIAGDDLLRLALAADTATAVVLGHTRWASVGIISQPNAHPLDSRELERPDGPYVTAVLNGDVDNFADLKAADGLRVAAEITTDAKVIPTLVSRRLAGGVDLTSAFRNTVAAFEGSVAIAASSASQPDQLLLALRGSGQALYVGLLPGCFVVASEPYGVVELTDTYLRMDGETPANEDNPTASRGQIVRLDGARAGRHEAILRQSYDGTDLPVAEADLSHAEITTRDIDRGAFPHFLLKEITEAPQSFRKTLRGKLVDEGAGPVVVLGPDVLPPDVVDDLQSGAIERVEVIGQGTAHVAGQSLAAALLIAAPDGRLRVQAQQATELSGFGLRPEMRDTLVIAISQSGTTTDTNRTVDLARDRGARVIAIVNRRSSDLTDKADGVLYTSDGRDVEMSVASTKAFYSQIAAGFLLAWAIATEVGGTVDPEVVSALRSLPEALEATVSRRAAVAAVAQQLAPPKRYWAIVGNGSNRIAAEELRIKLSELCYKAIACDATEDKKHIDLSSEPLILVCAAGLEGSTADDVAKEVAIYRAHKATPIVLASDGEERFAAALQVLFVPATHPQLAFVLACMAGHLFGYEAALAIDAQALPLRAARAAIEEAVGESAATDGDDLLRSLRPAMARASGQFFDGLRSGAYDGHLEASTAVRLASSLRYAVGVAPLESYQAEHGRIGTPAVVIDDLTAALTQGIEELTRPVDAIKHQAKTVTVGISRSDETLLQPALVQAVLAAGTARDRLTYKTLRTLADLDPAVAEVTGWIRYEIEGDAEDGEVPVAVVDRGGIALDIPTRAEKIGTLRGTKHTVALERQVFVTRGRKDGRTIVIVPETKDDRATGITLLHVRFHDHLSVGAARGALQGYRNRWAALRDAVLETEPTFRDDLLTTVPTVDLLVAPLADLADRWRTKAS
ncbi:MAG: SIS domain-containing protein [Acidimicrobiales bacterium]|nr:SIS domain-containing protein [Acidimicrobiales bacterium]